MIVCLGDGIKYEANLYRFGSNRAILQKNLSFHFVTFSGSGGSGNNNPEVEQPAASSLHKRDISISCFTSKIKLCLGNTNKTPGFLLGFGQGFSLFGMSVMRERKVNVKHWSSGSFWLYHFVIVKSIGIEMLFKFCKLAYDLMFFP